jgi:hypothetical protein
VHFSAAHKRVAILLAEGFDRETVADLSGYSPGHISRIARMPAARSAILDSLCLMASGIQESLIERAEQFIQRHQK